MVRTSGLLTVATCLIAAANLKAQDAQPFPAPKNEPAIVTPGRTSSDAPSDAIVLFDVKGEGQERGNSGVFLMGRYEVQVLDSYQNKTYYHGQAGAVYKQYAPLVNASRPPGQWQSYDIIFHAPRFDEQGKVTDRARVTVLHNGVLIQNNVEIYGNTFNDRPALYIAHAPELPLRLQDHGNPVRYRNIWIRRL
jgi:hypothetical protein